MSIWDEAKKNLAELYTVTADKTSELAKVTSRRYDKFGLSRDMERQFSELGSIVYLALQEERDDVLKSPEVAALLARITDLEQELLRKEDEIEEIHRDHAERKAAAAAAGGADDMPAGAAPAAETDPTGTMADTPEADVMPAAGPVEEESIAGEAQDAGDDEPIKEENNP